MRATRARGSLPHRRSSTSERSRPGPPRPLMRWARARNGPAGTRRSCSEWLRCRRISGWSCDGSTRSPRTSPPVPVVHRSDLCPVKASRSMPSAVTSTGRRRRLSGIDQEERAAPGRAGLLRRWAGACPTLSVGERDQARESIATSVMDRYASREQGTTVTSTPFCRARAGASWSCAPRCW